MDKLAQVQAQIAQLNQIQQLMANPAAMQQALAALNQATVAPVQTVQQSDSENDHGKMLETWISEFTHKEPDEGKKLSASLTKFARFVQSKLAKPEV